MNDNEWQRVTKSGVITVTVRDKVNEWQLMTTDGTVDGKER